MKAAGCNFSFSVTTNLHVGAGICRSMSDLLGELETGRHGIVVDKGVGETSYFAEVRRDLAKSCHIVHEFSNPIAEPDYDYLDTACDTFRDKDVSCIHAFGGGSTLDLAKGICVLLTNPGPGKQYRGFDLVKNPGIPLVAVPTTAGTGSEVTPNAVFTDRQEQKKFGINTSLYLPKLTLLDPLMVGSCPRSVTLSAGMDALTHSVESYAAKSATPMSRFYSLEAFRLIFNNLRAMLEDQSNEVVCQRMQLGAFLAGIALPNAGPGPAGAMSYPLGVHFKVPHGTAGAMFLEPIARLNATRGCDLYADLYDLIDGPRVDLDRLSKALEFCNCLKSLGEDISLPGFLDDFGVQAKHIASLAEETFALKGAIDGNPVPVQLEDILTILRNMLR